MSIADRRSATVEEYRAYRQRFHNWGRWGADDQLGTLNHITPDVRRAAAALVRDGRSISCSNPWQTAAVQPDPRRNTRPAQFEMSVNPGGSGDYIGVYYHGFVTTHIDALCHMFTGEEWGPERQLYNGRPASMVTTERAETNSVDYWRDGIVTRGVLYDIPRMREQRHVQDGEPVEGWDLDDFARLHGITPRAGDAVLVRSGAEPFWAAHPDFEHAYPLNTPGVAVSALEFLYDTNASLLAWDFMEASHQEQYGEQIPLHRIAIPHMGMPLLDNANFERLSQVCAESGRYEFLFTVAPLVVLGGTGSPVNPIATF
ncbi:MAG: cyclase family protein [Dehalococcoidia bacterium]